MAMVRPLGWVGPGEKKALVGRGLLNAPLPPVSGAWCGRLRLECLGRAEAAARNMAAAPSPNLFGATLQLAYTDQAINDTLACITRSLLEKGPPFRALEESRQINHLS